MARLEVQTKTIYVVRHLLKRDILFSLVIEYFKNFTMFLIFFKFLMFLDILNSFFNYCIVAVKITFSIKKIIYLLSNTILVMILKCTTNGDLLFKID